MHVYNEKYQKLKSVVIIGIWQNNSLSGNETNNAK